MPEPLKGVDQEAFTKFYEEAMTYDVPEHIIRGLFDWIMYGHCGDFLQAVMENDLMEAFGRADGINQTHMFEICRFIYNEMPACCHGNKEMVKEWNGLRPLKTT